MALYIKDIPTKNTTSSNKQVLDSGFLKKEITWLSSSFGSKVKEGFYAEMALLLKAGITVKDALPLCQETIKKSSHKNIIADITTAIISGATLYKALSQHKNFTQYEIQSIRIGEETGSLNEVLEQLGAYFGKRNEQKRQLVSALTYPSIILLTAVLVVLFMLSYVVPMFQDIFEQQKVELPGITQFIIGVSLFLKNKGWVIMLTGLLGMVAVKFINRKLWFKKFLGVLQLKLPIIGPFLKNMYLTQFTQAVTLLSASKVPILTGIGMVKDMMTFYPLKLALMDVEQQLLKGETLSDSLKRHDIFENKVIALVKVAEETNKTQYIFQRLHFQYSTALNQQSKLLSTLLEPLIIMLVGLMVGVILVSMYLPMFKLSSVLG